MEIKRVVQQKALVVYCYHEDVHTRHNLEFFVNQGILDKPNYLYLFVINGHICTVPIPGKANIRVAKRDNDSDLSAYEFAIRETKALSYDIVLFVNSSCLGPFLPAWSSQDWISIFAQHLSDTVVMVGPVLEVPPDELGFIACGEPVLNQPNRNIPFIHTYMFAVNRKGLEIIRESFPSNSTNKQELVLKYERLLTAKILLSGLNVKCLMAKYQGVDCSCRTNWEAHLWTKPGLPTCPEVPSNYDGIDLHPLEVIFFKNIRGAHGLRPAPLSGLSVTSQKVIQAHSGWAIESYQRRALKLSACRQSYSNPHSIFRTSQ